MNYNSDIFFFFCNMGNILLSEVVVLILQFDQMGYKWMMVHCVFSGNYTFLTLHT